MRDSLKDLIHRFVRPLMELRSRFILERMGHVNCRSVKADRSLLNSKACRNSVVNTLTPASPLLSRSFRSCVVHEVHDPQSDSAMITAWHSSAIPEHLARCNPRVGGLFISARLGSARSAEAARVGR